MYLFNLILEILTKIFSSNDNLKLFFFFYRNSVFSLPTYFIVILRFLFAGFVGNIGLLVRWSHPGTLAEGLLDVVYHRFLVQRVAEPAQPDHSVGVQGKTSSVLDDRFLQPTGVFDGYETGNIQGSQRLDA